MFTREEVISSIHDNITEIMLKHDYEVKINKETNFIYLLSEKKWGYDYFPLPKIKFTPDKLKMSLVIHRRINLLEEVWEDFASLINVNYDNKYDITTLRASHMNSYSKILEESYYNRYGSLEFVIDENTISNVIPKILNFLLIEKIIPYVNKFNDLKFVDQVFNSSLDPSQELFDYTINNDGFIFKRIAVAKFVGNPNFDNIINHIRSRFPATIEYSKQSGNEFYANYPIIFDTVYEKLRSVKPLDNTILQ